MNKLVLFYFILLLASCNTFNFGNYRHKEVNYISSNDFRLDADLYSPLNVNGKKPLVIVIHGGGWRSRSGDMVGICQELADQGFMALNITYRLSPQYHYPTQKEDVKAVMSWINKNYEEYNIDPDKIFVWGYSAGAHLAFNMANEKDIKIKAIVVGGIPAYLPAYPKSEMITNFLGYKYDDNKQIWEAASPVNLVSEATPPTFIYHGEADTLVDISQSEMLEKKLAEKNIPHEFYRISLMGHFAVYLFSEESIARGIKFIKKQL